MDKRGVSFEYLSQRKGQVAIFIIIALVIVGLAVLFFFLTPELRTDVAVFDPQNPQAFMQSCLEDRVRDVVETVSLQGGSMNPENSIQYNGHRIGYICYTSENLALCKINPPFLSDHIEEEIRNEIVETGDVEFCFNSLQESYQEINYNPQLTPGRTEVKILPTRIEVNFPNYVLTVSRDGVERYDSFRIVINNNLYQLLNIANDIVDWEATEGNFDVIYYNMIYGRTIDISQEKQGDGSEIYTLENRNTGEIFQFATRSLARGPGYEEIPIIFGDD